MSTRAIVRFHTVSGGRIASRNAIATLSLILVVLGSAPDPLIFLRFLALGVAGAGHAPGPLVGLVAVGAGLARDAVARLTLGLGGWIRGLPLDGVQHRRGVTYGMLIIQLPLAAAVLLAAGLTVALYHTPLSWPKVLGAGIGVCAGGAAMVPARRGIVARPMFGAAAVLAALGQWPMLVASIALFVVAELVAGPLRVRAPRRAIDPAPAIGLGMHRITWRAVRWRLIAPVPVAVLALAAAWFYTRNNVLTASDVGFVARLWSTIALALYVGAVGDLVATRRPPWPWSRSLPWSSAVRAVDNAIAVGLPALPVAIAAMAIEPRTVVSALAVLPPLAATAAALLPSARRRLTRVSGPMVVVGAMLGTLVAFAPWLAGLALLCTPLLLRLAARRDRGEIVTGWKELHHEAAGDSLAWSSR